MVIFDIVTTHTTLEPDSFFLFFLALTEGKKLFSTEFCTMDNSFLNKFFKDAIECCLIHLS